MFRALGAAFLMVLAAPWPCLLARADSPQTLSLAWEAEPRTLDPRYAVDANSQYLEDLLHCALVSPDEEGRLRPHLARSWTWTTPTTLLVDLTPNVHFADGSLVTAADVAATYRFFKDEKAAHASPLRGTFAALTSIEAKDKTKVVFQLRSSDASFVSNLVVGILPAPMALGPMINEARQVVGCGPFVLAQAASSGLELVPNKHYGLGNVPHLSRVHLKIVKDENTRYAKLIAGELDLVQNLLSRDKLTVIAKDHPKLQLLRRPGLNTTYLGFNMRDPLLAQPAVRQAIARAIDKDKIIKYVLNGMASPAATLLLPTDPYYAPNLRPLTYDPAKAQGLLDAAGLKPDASGVRFKLSFKTTTDQTRVAVAKAIAAELRRIGIAVTVETLEWGRFKADVEHGHVQMWSLSWIGFKDPDIYRFAFATASFPPDGGNRGWYSNPEVDRLLTAGRLETDQVKRAAVYGQAEQLIANDAPYAFLWHEDVFAVVNSQVEGFAVYADGRLSSLSRVTNH